MSTDSSNGTYKKDEFANTRWSIVIQAGVGDTSESREALTKLCETYWYPLYVYARRRVNDRVEAEDLTQAFFAEFLEKNFVASADRERGRFRAFLITAFRNFLSKQWEKDKAAKRGGGKAILSLDFQGADTQFGSLPGSKDLAPDQLFNRQWAISLLNKTLKQLEHELNKDGKESQFNELKGFITGDRSGKTYAEAAEALGISVAAAKMSASRLRGRFQLLLRQEIAETVSDSDSVEDEIRSLFGAFS